MDLKSLNPEWEVIEDKLLKRKFEFKNFKEAMEFVNKVADLAENENHHPDIKINYNKVAISFTTHSIGALSEKDFTMAAEVEKLV